MSSTKQTNRIALSFASVDSWVESNIASPRETNLVSKNRVQWGDNNDFPEYLLGLYNSVPTLRSIISGNVDYIVGDDIAIQPFRSDFAAGVMNLSGDTVNEQIRAISRDWELYGGFALQVIRNYAGEIAEIYYLDMRFLRTNKDCNVFYYSESWDKGGKNIVIYPAFVPKLEWAKLSDEERNRHASSILFVKDVHTQVYPAPIYLAALKACEMERQIADFHLSDLNNHFTSSAIINFNQGVPDDAQKHELERELNEKFSGAQNAGRIMYSWNPDKENATDIVTFEMKDFGERYKSLSTLSRQQIFTAFRAIPLLFGLTAETNTGFSTEEFEQSFKLYNRTQVRPIQRIICEAYDKIFGRMGTVTIMPFTLEGDVEKEVN